jgi:hypothetical protein
LPEAGVDGDAGVPAAVPAVGVELAFLDHDVVEEDVDSSIPGVVGPAPHLMFWPAPADGGVVAPPRWPAPAPGAPRARGYVPAVGGAAEEDVGCAPPAAPGTPCTPT